MRNTQKKARSSSFFRTAFISFLSITIVSTILLAGFLTTNYFDLANQLIFRFSDNLLVQSNYSITYINELAKRLANTLFSDKDIIAFLNVSAKDNMSTIVANNTLNKHLLPLPYVESVYLYNREIDLLLSTKDGKQYEHDEFYDQDIISWLNNPDLLAGRRERPISHTVTYNGSTASVCSYILYELGADGAVRNALVINISASTLTESLATINSYNKEAKFLVLDENGALLGRSPFPTGETTTDVVDSLAALSRQPESQRRHTVTIGNTRYLMTCNSSNKNGWTIFGLVPNSILFQELISTTVISIIIAVLIFLACAFLCLFLAKRLNRPVQAITRLVQGDSPPDAASSGWQSDEFRFIADVISSMREQNRQYDRFKSETAHSMKQDFLASLVSGDSIYTLERNTKQLPILNIEYIGSHTLCMCLFQIDRYQDFAAANNEKERWALRYAIINIASELLSKSFTFELFRMDSDKFIALIDCEAEADYNKFAEKLRQTLNTILEQISSNLDFSLTAAYGSFFQGLDHLPRMYDNLGNLLQLKIKYGGNRVIDPQLAEETNCDDFEIPMQTEDLLVEKILNGETEAALLQYRQIAESLFEYSYNEIVTYAIKLAYRIYDSVKSRNPALKEESASLFRSFMGALPQCETASDYDKILTEMVEDGSAVIIRLREHPAQQNSELIVQRIRTIVENEYSHKDLCLNSIAEELGLSSNYIGHVFKTVENKSVAKYIADLRMEKIAYYLKTTSLPVAKIIDKVGLEKNNYFYTCFKKYFGMSLGQYRLTLPGQTEVDDDEE